MKKLLIGLSALLVLLLSGCATTSPNAPIHTDTKAKQFVVDKGKSNIYVYRNEFFGAAVSMPVTLDGQNVGTTGADTYLKLITTPGNHILTSKAENVDTLQLTTQANKNYFVWQEVKLGVVFARSDLKLVSEQEGKKGVNECKLVLQSKKQSK